MTESPRLTRLSFVLILAASLIAMAVIASAKFGQPGEKNGSLLVPVANIKQPAAGQVADRETSLPDVVASSTGSAPELVDPKPALFQDVPAPPAKAESAAEEEANVQEKAADASGEAAEETSADGAVQDKKDPRKTLSRQFARRRATSQEASKPAIRAAATVPIVIHEPRVAMSADHQKTCVVGVGDVMPDLQLADNSGKAASLNDVMGDAYTVVVFWSLANPFAVEQFTHLAADVIHPFEDARLRAVAIHVGQPGDIYAELCEKFGTEAVCLVDADKSNFAQVATRKLPRTYLLDAAGKILWFDIEYSRTTRHELLNAVQYHLQGQRATPEEESSADDSGT